MKQNQIEGLPKLDSENLENIFNVYKDKDGMYFYNLLQTVNLPFNLPPNLFTSYTIKHGDTWPYISFKAYKSPNLWWLILMANNIQDPTIKLIPGVTIALPIASVVTEVLAQIKAT